MFAYTSLSVFLFSAIALVVPSGFSLGAVMLLLGSAWLLRPSARRFRLNGEDKLLIAALLIYFAVNVALGLIHHTRGSEYDPPLRFLVAVPALLLLLAYPPRHAAFWLGVALGSLGAGVLSLWQLTVADVARPGGSTNPIQFGNIAIVLALVCACGFIWARQQPRRGSWFILLAAGVAGGLTASILSGSRGSWLALPLCMIPAFALLLKHGRVKTVLCIMLGCAALSALLWLVPQTGFKARTELAANETSSYMGKKNAENADTSVGQRFEMWRIGLLMAPQRLALGWGREGMMEQKAMMVRQGLAAPLVIDHTHLHNEYLDALVKRGIPGLLALLLLYGTPLVLFARHLTERAEARAYAVAGLLLVLSYIAFGVTQAFLTHNNGVMIFAFMTVTLWSLLRNSAAGLDSQRRY